MDLAPSSSISSSSAHWQRQVVGGGRLGVHGPAQTVVVLVFGVIGVGRPAGVDEVVLELADVLGGFEGELVGGADPGCSVGEGDLDVDGRQSDRGEVDRVGVYGDAAVTFHRGAQRDA